MTELDAPVGLQALCPDCGEAITPGGADCLLCEGEPPISEAMLFVAWCELWLDGTIDSLGRLTPKAFGF